MDVPDNVFAEVMRHTKTRPIALITVVMDYNRRMRIAGLAKYPGTEFQGAMLSILTK